MNSHDSKTAELRREAIAWVLALGLLYAVYRVVEPFVSALLWGAILAIFLQPLHRRVTRLVKGRNAAALLSVTLAAVLVLAPLTWLAPAFVKEAVDTVANLPTGEIVERLEGAAGSVSLRWPTVARDLEGVLEETLRGVRGSVAGWSARLVGGVAGAVIDLVVVILLLFYLFRDGPRLVDLLRDISPFGGERHDRMVTEAIEMISVTISSGFFVSFVQGVLGGVSFAIVGLPSPVFWGVMTGVLAFLPFVGAWLVWLPAGVGLLLAGQTGRGVALLLLGAVLVSTVDNVLRPILIAGRSQMNGLLVFVSVLGGVSAYGLLGAVLGPLVMAAAVGLVTGYRDSVAAEDRAPGEA